MPLARLYAQFDHPDWLFELKYDEFRGLRLTPQSNYFTLVKMMTSVQSASDSISTRPNNRAKRMAAAAPGLRPIPSAAAAVALACANPQPAEATAIEKPAVMATQ